MGRVLCFIICSLPFRWVRSDICSMFRCLLFPCFFLERNSARTIVAALFTPLVMNTLSVLSYPSEEALHKLDPSLLLGGCINMTEHLMLTSIIGAVVIGVGCGIVVRSQATTGGTDIVAMLLQKYCHIHFSKAILLVDGIVVLFGLLVIGFGIGNPDDSTQPSWHLSFYSLIAIFVTSRVIAYVINGEKNDKILFVISDMRLTELHDYILKDLTVRPLASKVADFIRSRTRRCCFWW